MGEKWSKKHLAYYTEQGRIDDMLLLLVGEKREWIADDAWNFAFSEANKEIKRLKSQDYLMEEIRCSLERFSQERDRKLELIGRAMETLRRKKEGV